MGLKGESSGWFLCAELEDDEWLNTLDMANVVEGRAVFLKVSDVYLLKEKKFFSFLDSCAWRQHCADSHLQFWAHFYMK